MENLTIKRLHRVETPNPIDHKKGIVSFQLVDTTIYFYGHKVEQRFDTRIMKDGSQFVLNGSGFIPSGTEITNY